MKSFWNKLKKRLGIKSNFQVIIVLIVFTITGFSTLYSHRLINSFLQVNTETAFFIKLIIFVFLILPIWMLFFLFWGTLLGQKKFVVNFLKLKIRLLFNKKRNNKENEF